ncbi:MAG: hypothetical protein K2Y29_08090 [Beijerinckiaceae bacterium]|nr:hypothetical protein [Beijerinckiaceae bacterium]
MNVEMQINEENAVCPIGFGDAASLTPDDVLVLEAPRRMVLQYAKNDEGADELRLFYGDKEVSFDEPHLFAFGETLARQSTFAAREALGWASGYSWSEIAPLLEALLDEQILVRACDARSLVGARDIDRRRPSPLPPARATSARNWDDCESLTRELTGRSVEQGYLELVIPVFRIAHPELDTDGRQVGEANVFPRALRLEAETEWATCIYSGTRHMVDRPMNVTALKTMRAHWPQMMAALRRLRAAFLSRRPEIVNGWRLGDIEQLATFILAIPTYQLMKKGDAARPLHPVLSSLFRVTDGLRMVTHQMMFVPIGEPPLPFDAPLTAADIQEYAERNYSFHSETGVCAGPRHFVRAFLDTLLDGVGGGSDDDVHFTPEVAIALQDADKAFDYALHALRAHAVLFRFWPLMSRAYEQIAKVAAQGAASGAAGFAELEDAWRPHMRILKTGTYLAVEQWRLDREAAYVRMFDECSNGLGARFSVDGLPARLGDARERGAESLGMQVERVIGHALGDGAASSELARVIADFALDTQAHLRVAAACQAHVNALLGRATPAHAFEAADAHVHTLLQEGGPQRLPFLLDELRNGLGLSLSIATDRIDVHFANRSSAQVCPLHTNSTGIRRVEQGAKSA